MFQVSPATPKIELDANFSRILQKKREEQLEASRLKLCNSSASMFDSTVEASHTEKKSESLESVPVKRNVAIELESSMFGKVNESWHDLSEGEDSFLALERQCNMDDKRDRLINANDTLLFDVEPPSELWNDTINHTIAEIADLDKIEEGDERSDEDTIEMSSAMLVGITRPSTIIEETSSQVDSTCKSTNSTYKSVESTIKGIDSSSSACSSFNETSSTIVIVKELSATNCDTTKETDSKKQTIISPLVKQNTKVKVIERSRRGTFAFKRANYTFFSDENSMPINESVTTETSISDSIDFKSAASKESKTVAASPFIASKILTPQRITTTKNVIVSPNIASSIIKSTVEEPKTPTTKLIDINSEQNSAKKQDEDNNEEDQFNNTLERVDYLLEKGKEILEETPVSKRSSHHNSLLETPLFSCKRKRLLSEMASEMLPLPKRGPLIDFSTPEVIGQSRFSKLARK